MKWAIGRTFFQLIFLSFICSTVLHAYTEMSPFKQQLAQIEAMPEGLRSSVEKNLEYKKLIQQLNKVRSQQKKIEDANRVTEMIDTVEQSRQKFLNRQSWYTSIWMKHRKTLKFAAAAALIIGIPTLLFLGRRRARQDLSKIDKTTKEILLGRVLVAHADELDEDLARKIRLIGTTEREGRRDFDLQGGDPTAERKFDRRFEYLFNQLNELLPDDLAQRKKALTLLAQLFLQKFGRVSVYDPEVGESVPLHPTSKLSELEAFVQADLELPEMKQYLSVFHPNSLRDQDVVDIVRGFQTGHSRFYSVLLMHRAMMSGVLYDIMKAVRKESGTQVAPFDNAFSVQSYIAEKTASPVEVRVLNYTSGSLTYDKISDKQQLKRFLAGSFSSYGEDLSDERALALAKDFHHLFSAFYEFVKRPKFVGDEERGFALGMLNLYRYLPYFNHKRPPFAIKDLDAHSSIGIRKIPVNKLLLLGFSDDQAHPLYPDNLFRSLNLLQDDLPPVTVPEGEPLKDHIEFIIPEAYQAE